MSDRWMPAALSSGGPLCHPVQRWAKAGRPPLSAWDPGELPGKQTLSLAALPTPLRWEIAYGILQARQTNDVVRQEFKFASTMVHDLAASGITSLLEHAEHEWPAIRADRNHGQVSTHLRTGFLTFAIDELDKLRGAYSSRARIRAGPLATAPARLHRRRGRLDA